MVFPFVEYLGNLLLSEQMAQGFDGQCNLYHPDLAKFQLGLELLVSIGIDLLLGISDNPGYKASFLS